VLASGAGRRLLFTRTKHAAKRLARQLSAAGIPAVDLHGNLNQNARDRNLAQFAGGEVGVLVATDVAARGIHVDDVVLVVHVDPPAEHKAYLHRSGRTARAGATGDVVTVMLPNQRGDVRTLARQAGIAPVIQSVRPGSPQTRELVGPALEPRTVRAPEPVVATGTPGRAAGSERGAGSGRRSARTGQPGAGGSRRRRGSAGSPGRVAGSTGHPNTTAAAPRPDGPAAPRTGGAAAFSSASRSAHSGARRRTR